MQFPSNSIVSTLAIAGVLGLNFMSAHPSAADSLDPNGCIPLTNEQLRNLGYEPVIAYGATPKTDPNDNSPNWDDDKPAIQAAIDQAQLLNRAVYFHPGEYKINSTLEIRQDPYVQGPEDNGNRFGSVLLGSYCGSARPSIRLKSNVAPKNNNIHGVEANPYPVVAIWRPYAPDHDNYDPVIANSDRPYRNSEASRDWNQVVRNLEIKTGNNPGAVALWHEGAEGASVQEVTLNAYGGFAGLYNLHASGGYISDVQFKGGEYGVFAPNTRGGSAILVGVKFEGQSKAAIAYNDQAPLNLVGFDINAKQNHVIRWISGSWGDYQVSTGLTGLGDSGGHVSLVDGKVNLHSGANEMLDARDRAVYISNLYVKGSGGTNTVVNHSGTSNLEMGSGWRRIDEYSGHPEYDGYSNFNLEGKLIDGVAKDDKIHDGSSILVTDPDPVIVVERDANIPDFIASRTYVDGLCNPEGANVVYADDIGVASARQFGANRHDTLADHNNIKNAIAHVTASATDSVDTVFLGAGIDTSTNPNPTDFPTAADAGRYYIYAPINLGRHGRLCGVSRYGSILDATQWSLAITASNTPVVKTWNDKWGSAVLADVKIEVGDAANPPQPPPDPSQPPPPIDCTDLYLDPLPPHVFALEWRVGQQSIVRDIWPLRRGTTGERVMTVIKQKGGGQWYGIIQHGGTHPSQFAKLSTRHQHLLVQGTAQPLSFYSFHMQHLTPLCGTQGQFDNAKNIEVFGVKAESASKPANIQQLIEDHPEDSIPTWLKITDGSENIRIVGWEGLVEQGVGRSIIEIDATSHGITIANMGRRDKNHADCNESNHPYANYELAAQTCNHVIPEDLWFFVDDGYSGATFRAHGFLALFKN